MKLQSLRRLIIVGFFIFLSGIVKAQGFSFNCSKDTLVPGCPTNLCITLKTLIPDLHGLTSSYSLNPGSSIPGCFPIYGAPDDPAGTSTNLTNDDTYSIVINIGFPFPFYGTTYNDLVASTNGYLSFDISLTGLFSHWQNRGDLPNTQYDKALIMGPYHDLDPSLNTTNKIQYQVFGTAPHRRWILSFYKVPLFNCASLVENTHQIILYESTGIIEVKIFDKEICTTWNGGKAMVGIQDFTRTLGMTAPARKMSDPSWGSIGMNETWRFVPDAGASLFKRVELYDMSNNLLITGTVAPYSSGVLEASFPNLCAPAGATTSYIVKSVYEKIDDPTVEIFGMDTIRVNRANPLTANVAPTPADCGTNNGTLTITGVSGGTAPYQYSLNGTTWQASNVFTGLASGSYTVYVRDAPAVCSTTIPATISLNGNISATTSFTQTACAGVNNGTITVTSAGGTGPYTFTLDGGAPVPGTIPFTFTNLSAGPHTVLVTDVSTSCTSLVLNVTITNGTGVLGNASSTATSCAGAANGTITANATAGTAPFTYTLDGGAPQNGANPYTFTNVTAGGHTVVITDNVGCTRTINVTVPVGPGIAGNATSTVASCAIAANGTITANATTGVAPFTFSLDGGPPQSGTNPYTFNNVTAGSHTVLITDNIGCTVTISVIVGIGSGVNAIVSQTATSCPAVSDGSVTANATTGTAPFTYSLDGGPAQSGGNPYTFIGVASGPHTVLITDNAGCNVTLNITVAAGPVLTANAASTATSCSGATNGTIIVTPTNGTAPYTFSLDGGPFVAGAAPYTFTNVAAGTHTVLVTDAATCVTNSISVDVPAGPALTTTVTPSAVLCNTGATGSITVTQPVIGTPPYQYSLDGVTWQASNIFNGLIAGTYTVYYRESNGCQGSQTVTITEPAALSSSAATVPVVCNGQTNGIITITAGGGVTPYQYSIDGGVTWQAGNIFNVAAGNYNVIIRDGNNCTKIQSANVTEPAILTANSSNSNASCNGGNDGMITVNAAGGNLGYSYSIDGGVTWQSSNTFNVAPGNYVVNVKDNLGCTTSFNTVVGLTNDLTFTPQTDPFICEGTSTQLQLTSNALVYSWTPATGLSSTTIPNPVANPTVTTQYIVTATLGRCSANDTVIVNVNPAPIPNAGPDGDICYGQSYMLQGSGGTQYLWSPSTYLNNPNISNPVSTPDKTITYTLMEVRDAIGCKSLVTDDVTVNVTPPIKVQTFPFDTVAYAGDQFQINATSIANIYTWTPATGLSNPGIANPVVTVGPIGSDVVYKVTASTAAGCKGEGYVRVKVYTGPDIYVPTGFTPNADGKNDKLTPFPVGIASIKYFRVFNRWGQMIFSTNTLHEGWDGKLGGVEQPTGIYIWTVEGITKTNKIIKKKGTVSLIR
ncbi:MAG: gliding motility-associated C-terminal domain-containing protein [Sphingobacteriales bacterium]|nr:gliding motility-associated C-terminal domain-containing protein [Sphingobacteriales bacterium]